MADPNDFNTRVIAEFRAQQGRVGGFFEGRTLLILHTRGAKSGAARVTPLICRPDAGRYFVLASNGGQAHHPAWYHNVLAHPEVSIELPEGTRNAVARIASEPERTRLATGMEAYMPVFAGYREKAGRVIPVVVLTPEPDAAPAPTRAELEAFVAGLPDVQREDAHGYSMFFVGDDHRLPFVSFISADHDHDRVSNLDRLGVFRVNIGLPGDAYAGLVAGLDPAVVDQTRLNTFLPHPEYARQHYVSILNPAGANVARVQALLRAAHAHAAR